MRIAYPSGYYRPDRSTGGNAHIGQFINNSVALGHEVWTWPGGKHPAARSLPVMRLERLRALRRMDVIYVRVEWSPPDECRWGKPPLRQILGSPVFVWEFNAVPEQGLDLGEPGANVRTAIRKFRKYGPGCDLAICVSSALADYVRDKLGIKRVLTVPNGSDPDLFDPEVAPVVRVQRGPNRLNVIWIGSANLAWHNTELLLAAAELLWQRGEGERIIFHILGEGLRLMRDMPPNVNYYGPERYEAMPHWLAAMDIGLSLYRPGAAHYGSPLKVFDYMASGLAVVSTFQEQVQEVFDQLGQSDLLVPHDDANALADVLLELSTDRKRVRCLGDSSRELVISFYNWRRAVADILSKIETIRNERG